MSRLCISSTSDRPTECLRNPASCAIEQHRNRLYQFAKTSRQCCVPGFSINMDFMKTGTDLHSACCATTGLPKLPWGSSQPTIPPRVTRCGWIQLLCRLPARFTISVFNPASRCSCQTHEDIERWTSSDKCNVLPLYWSSMRSLMTSVPGQDALQDHGRREEVPLPRSSLIPTSSCPWVSSEKPAFLARQSSPRFLACASNTVRIFRVPAKICKAVQ
jgi:hypothetical protein